MQKKILYLFTCLIIAVNAFSISQDELQDSWANSKLRGKAIRALGSIPEGQEIRIVSKGMAYTIVYRDSQGLFRRTMVDQETFDKHFSMEEEIDEKKAPLTVPTVPEMEVFEEDAPSVESKQQTPAPQPEQVENDVQQERESLPAFGPKNPLTWGLFVVGLVAVFVGAVWFYVVAFKYSLGWGLLCVFVPFASLAFLIRNWEDTKRPFAINAAGLVLCVLGVFL